MAVWLRRLAVFLLFWPVAFPVAAAAGDGAGDWASGSTPVSARLTAAPVAVGELGEIHAGLEVRLGPGWKTYWRAPGDAGLPPAVDWAGSENLAAAELDYPAPHRFSVLGIETIGYDGAVTFPLRLRPQRPGAPLVLRARVELLVCADICVPERYDLSLTLPAGPADPSPHANGVARAFAQIPGDGRAAGLRLERLEAQGASLRAVVAADPPLRQPDLFVESEPYLAFAAPVTESAGPGLTALRLSAIDPPPGTSLAGRSLRLTLTDGERSMDITAVAGDITAAAVAPAADDRPAPVTLAAMLVTALLGGFILNLMPCVLPVLSLKLLSLVRHAGEGRGRLRAGLLASAAGIIASFLALAAVTAGLKTAGVAVGWGVQFQQPLFLGFMIAVLLLFAGSLSGLFEIPLPRVVADRISGPEGSGLGGAFLTGAFATLLATPCSAPFLGTAVGFALAAGTAEILVIFAALGLGMAAPYLLAAAFPVVAGWLPRPGRWMVGLRRVMALALLGTAAWLGLVLDAALRGPAPASALAAAQDGGGGARWAAFDEAAIAGHVAAGRVVLVDVTADWCVTCQANKRLVLNRDPVAAKLADPRVIALRADWTRPDDAIAGYLARHGRYGIPFNMVYGPGAPAGIALPELLSDSAVLAALAQAGL